MQQIGIAAFPGQRQGPVVNKPFSVLLTWQILAYCGDFRNSRGGRSSPRQASKIQRRSAADGADARRLAAGRHRRPRVVPKAEFGCAAAAPKIHPRASAPSAADLR